MARKAPNTLTDKELLDLIGEDTPGPNQSPIIEYKNDLMEFLSVYNIKEGYIKVSSNLLYKLYREWSNSPIQKKTFTEEMCQLFTYKRYGIGRFLLLNIKAFQLAQQYSKLMKPIDKTKRKGWKQHFDRYLEKYSIKSGGFFVKYTVLYNLYDKWVYKNKNRHPLGIDQFKNFCKLYFDYKTVQKCYWFSVDKSIIQHLSEEDLKELKGNNSEEKKNKKI